MFGKFNPLWRAKNIPQMTKIRLYEVFAVPMLMYGSECCSLLEEYERKILSAETSWLRRIIGKKTEKTGYERK